MPLDEDIRKAIEQSLPEQVGTVLKKRLEQAEKDAKELESATKNVTYYSDRAKDFQSQLDKHESLSKRSKALDEREAALLKREQEQAVIEVRRAAAEEKCNAIFELAGMAFRNPRFVTTERTDRDVPFLTQYGTETRHETAVAGNHAGAAMSLFLYGFTTGILTVYALRLFYRGTL